MIAFEERMKVLRERFRLRAAEDRDALIEALERSDRAALRRLAHDLYGTAGTFGFHEVGEAAMTLEDRLVAEAPEPDVRASCNALLDRLARLA